MLKLLLKAGGDSNLIPYTACTCTKVCSDNPADPKLAVFGNFETALTRGVSLTTA